MIDKTNDSLDANASTEDWAPDNDIELNSLLVLADSALPLGSFAYSNGLESYIFHVRRRWLGSPGPSNLQIFIRFLGLSLHSLANTSLAYCIVAHRSPHLLFSLDNDYDASTLCQVARRASIGQGRALIGLWERSFRDSYSLESTSNPSTDVLNEFARCVKVYYNSSIDSDKQSLIHEFFAQPNNKPRPVFAHYAPLFGAVTRAMAISRYRSAYLFMMNHARSLVSAGIRCSVLDPFQAQNLLASPPLRHCIRQYVLQFWHVDVRLAGQSVPAIDLWIGLHEKLYSRLFNA